MSSERNGVGGGDKSMGEQRASGGGGAFAREGGGMGRGRKRAGKQRARGRGNASAHEGGRAGGTASQRMTGPRQSFHGVQTFIPERFLTPPDATGGRRVQWQGFGTDKASSGTEHPVSLGGTIDDDSWEILQKRYEDSESQTTARRTKSQAAAAASAEAYRFSLFTHAQRLSTAGSSEHKGAAPYEKKGGDGSDDDVEDMDAEPFLQKQGE